MTERLYYTEPARTEFEARVVAVEDGPSGTVVELNRTAFYPTSGGQPHDTGVLGGVRVVDVRELDATRVGHVVDGMLAVGQEVGGAIDWPRRFDHMQQHSGQHVLSAAFERCHAAGTIGFHLGQAESTIDLDRDLSAAAVAGAEGEANETVWRNHPIAIKFATADEVASLALRKAPARSGTLRLIEIPNVDLSACGGTHVDRTGTIGLIGVTATERFKGGLRVSFVCGGRALVGFRVRRATLTASAQLFSVGESELPDQIARLQRDAKAKQRELRAAHDRLSEHEAGALAAEAEMLGGRASIITSVATSDASVLKRLATTLIAEPGRQVVLFSSGRPVLVVAGRSADLTLDAREVLRGLTERFGGRGGGQPDLAQGGGLDADPGDLRETARRLLAAG
jgi:alanyl-tRNA synthetase